MNKRLVFTSFFLGLIGLIQIPTAYGTFRLENSQAWDSAKRAYVFEYSPSSPASGTIKLFNNDQQAPVTLAVTAVDGKTNSAGQIYYTTSDVPQNYIGVWTSIPDGEVTLKPGEQKEVKFTITPPKDATPGDYAGGLIIENITPPPSSSQNTKAASGFSAVVKSRYAEKILFSIPGERKASYQFQNFSFNKKNAGFELKITNTGNMTLSANGEITVTDDETQKVVKTFPIKADSMLPLDSYTGTFPWKDHTDWGKYSATLKMDLFSSSPFEEGKQKIDSIEKETSVQFDRFDIVWEYTTYTIWVLALLILFLLLVWLKKKVYLSKCIPYTVLPDEKVVTIAEKFRMNWKKLVKINHIKAPYDLTAGQIILVRRLPETQNAPQK